MPETELRELAKMYERKGLSRETAQKVAAGADRARRAGRARRDRVRHRPGQPHQPVARRVRLDGRVHGRRAAAAARDHADPARRSGSGRPSSRSRSRWRSPARPGPARLQPRRRGRCCATSAAACSRWRVTYAVGSAGRHPRLSRHDADVRGGGAAAGGGRAPRRVPRGTPCGRRRSAGRRPSSSTSRWRSSPTCPTGSSTTWWSGSAARPRGVPPSRRRSPAAARSRTSPAPGCSGPGSTSTSTAAPSSTGWRPVPGRRPTGPAYAVDGQRFRPHLTLARLGHPARGDQLGPAPRRLPRPAWTVDRLTLVASYLGEGPRGRPRYEPVEEFALSG